MMVDKSPITMLRIFTPDNEVIAYAYMSPIVAMPVLEEIQRIPQHCDPQKAQQQLDNIKHDVEERLNALHFSVDQINDQENHQDMLRRRNA